MTRRGRGIFLSIFGVLVFYTGIEVQRMIPQLSQNEIWSLTVALFWTMLGGQIVYRSRPGLSQSRLFSLFTWSGSFVFGAWATFIMVALFVDISFIFRSLALRDWVDASKWIILSIAGVSVSMAGVGLKKALAGPLVFKIDVPVSGLSPELEGLLLVQISDLHVGPTIGKEYVERVVSQVLELKPDMIAVTGDLVDGTPELLKEGIHPLARLKAPLGVFYVTGNHEYYWGAETWIKTIQELGMTPLINENQVVVYKNRRILIGGICDSSAALFVPAHKSDTERAGNSLEPCDFKILLAHRPNSCVAAEKAGFDLQLSGHTHGGQFFPFSLLIGFFHLFTRGLNRYGKMWVYVNSGTGYWGPPNRLGVSSEITALRLMKAKPEGNKKDKLESGRLD